MIEWLAGWTPSLIVMIVSSAAGVFFARRHARIQTDQMAEQAKVQTQTQPIDALVRAMERQDSRLETVLGRDSEERRAIVLGLASIADGLKGLATDIASQRDDAQRRAGNLYAHLEKLTDRLGHVGERLATLEGKIQ
jgi:chromosome segregation ATPase